MSKNLKSLMLAVLISWIGVPLFAGTASGPVYFHVTSGYILAPNGSFVKFCKASIPGGIDGMGECYIATTSNGSFSVTLPNFQGYFFFAWHDPRDWGSSTTRGWTNTNGMIGDVVNFATSAFMNILTEPRPHKPNAVYPPNGTTNVPLNFTLKWTSGIDFDRSAWSVTYDVYAYGEGGSELKVLSDIACSPDASGNCSYFIDNVVPNWRYFWRVVPKIHVPGPGAGTVRIYDQSSQLFTFVTQP